MADKKISEETILTRDNTERIPVIQSDGSGGWVNGALEISDTDSNIYNSDGSLPPSEAREFDLNGGTLFLKDGALTVGDVGAGTQAGFNFINTIAGDGFLYNCTSGDGNALTAIMDNANTFGLNLKASYNKIFDSDITPDPGNENSSIFTVWSTRKGTLLVPRMTETERDSIVSPADYLEIVNTTKGMKDFYHPVFGWISSPISISMACSTTSVVTASTYYFSMAGGISLRSTIGGLAIRPVRKGKITKASFTRFIASTLGNRSYSLYIRINDTTDYLVATQGTTATETFFENSALNTNGIPVDVTDSIVMKLVVSGGTTDSANVLFFGSLVIN